MQSTVEGKEAVPCGVYCCCYIMLPEVDYVSRSHNRSFIISKADRALGARLRIAQMPGRPAR